MSKTAKEVVHDEDVVPSRETFSSCEKRSFTRRTSHSKSDAYVALANASRASNALDASSRFVTDSPPASKTRVVSAFSSASGRTPRSLAEILSAARASPKQTRAASSSPSTQTSSNEMFPSHKIAHAVRKTSEISFSVAPIARKECFVAAYASASSFKNGIRFVFVFASSVVLGDGETFGTFSLSSRDLERESSEELFRPFFGSDAFR